MCPQNIINQASQHVSQAQPFQHSLNQPSYQTQRYINQITHPPNQTWNQPLGKRLQQGYQPTYQVQSMTNQQPNNA